MHEHSIFVIDMFLQNCLSKLICRSPGTYETLANRATEHEKKCSAVNLAQNDVYSQFPKFLAYIEENAHEKLENNRILYKLPIVFQLEIGDRKQQNQV